MSAERQLREQDKDSHDSEVSQMRMEIDKLKRQLSKATQQASTASAKRETPAADAKEERSGHKLTKKAIAT